MSIEGFGRLIEPIRLIDEHVGIHRGQGIELVMHRVRSQFRRHSFCAASLHADGATSLPSDPAPDSALFGSVYWVPEAPA